MHNIIFYLQKAKRKHWREKRRCSGLEFLFLERERESHFSLDYRAIGPLKFFGARRKVALRGEAYEWDLVLRSFDKLREVGVLSYLKLHFV